MKSERELSRGDVVAPRALDGTALRRRAMAGGRMFYVLHIGRCEE